MAATNIAPYSPFRVWLRRASRHAISAASVGRPVGSQPYRSAQILRADQLAEGVRMSSRVRWHEALEEVAIRDWFGGEDPDRRQVIKPCLGDILGCEVASVLLHDPKGQERVVKVVILRRAVDNLAEARRAALAVPWPSCGYIDRKATRREVVPQRPVPTGFRFSRMPRRGIVDRLAQQAARSATEPRPCTRSWRRSGSMGWVSIRRSGQERRMSSISSGSALAAGRGKSAAESSNSSASCRSAGVAGR